MGDVVGGDGEPCTKRRRLFSEQSSPSNEGLFRQPEGDGISPSAIFTRVVSDIATTNTPAIDNCPTPQQVDGEGDGHKIGEETVCFGMLCEIRCQFMTSRGSQVADSLRRIRQQSEPLRLSKDFGTWTIVSPDDVKVGVVNHRTVSLLASLPSGDLLTYEAFMETADLEEKVNEYLGGKTKVQFDVVINVMGPRPIFETIGAELSKCQLFLQRPYHLPEGTTYINPQYLTMADCFEDESVGSAEQEDDNPKLNLLEQDQHSAHDSLVGELWNVIDNSALQGGMSRMDISQHIHTKLMEHQRDVVDFLISRESGTAMERGSLWIEESTDEGLNIFRHKITGVPSPAPTDVPGGILADDMGLGKTLSMIATIVTTLGSANGYVSSGEATRTNPRMKATPATLVIVPSALLLENWLEEIRKHVGPGIVRWRKYHGITRKIDLESAHLLDIVLSTYGTVAADLAQNRGLLNRIHWYRIVLDEAHAVRNWSTKQFRAIHQLSARNRWCMTGTPIQNSLEDLGALVRFIRLPNLEDPAKFRRHVIGGIKVAGQLVGANFENLRALLSSICIRRPNSLLSLPGIEFEECRPVLNLTERRQYNLLVQGCQQAIEKTFCHGKYQTYNDGVLESLLRLRLFCNCGIASLREGQNALSPNDKTLSLLQQNEDACCSYCHCEILTMDAQISDTPQNIAPVATHCRRLVCADCIPRLSDETSKFSRCPFCQEDSEEKQALGARVPNSSLPSDLTGPSSKTAALLNNVRERDGKCLVFSFWKQTLDYLAKAFEGENIRFARVDGSLSQSQRKKSLDCFCKDETIKVLLMTFGTGSTGLNNLSIAAHIHIFEPQWNPSIESQAIGRLFRHGQTNKVRVMRYVCHNTVEEAVENRQLRKVEIAHRGGLERSRNDRTPAKKTFMALTDYIAKYMASDDFKYTEGHVFA